jgi:hypothetical protein
MPSIRISAMALPEYPAVWIASERDPEKGPHDRSLPDIEVGDPVIRNDAGRVEPYPPFPAHLIITQLIPHAPVILSKQKTKKTATGTRIIPPVMRNSPGLKPDTSRTGYTKKTQDQQEEEQEFTAREVASAGAGLKGVFKA